MPRRNLSTSSSELPPAFDRSESMDVDAPRVGAATRSGATLRALRMVGWTALGLLLLDVMVAVVLPSPDGRAGGQNAFTQFFSWGDAIERKLAREMGATLDDDQLIVKAGWPSEADGEPAEPAPGDHRLVAAYGMSFTNRIADQLQEVLPDTTVRTISGPGAPPNHSFAAIERDLDRHQASVVYWGILTSEIIGLNTTTGLTYKFDQATPMAYPRYQLERGRLQSLPPPINTAREFHATYASASQWEAYRQWLAQHDPAYQALLFQATPLDNSGLLRLARRWFNNVQARRLNPLRASPAVLAKWAEGEGNQLAVMRAMISRFAEEVRQRDALPVIVLLHARGTDPERIRAVLGPTLQQLRVPTLDSALLADPDNPAQYVGDGHFTPEVDHQLAQWLAALIQASERGDLNLTVPNPAADLAPATSPER